MENKAEWRMIFTALVSATWAALLTGVVPFGYAQVKPKDGTPAPLVEGQKYFYFV